MDQVKILIVEDDTIQSLQMSKDLESMNYRVVGMPSSPRKAWELIRHHKPDLALIDINLTGQIGDTSGIELAKQVRNQYPIPFIYITASEDNATFQSAKMAKPQNYLVKPYRKEELYRAIELAMLNSIQDSHPDPAEDFMVVKDNMHLKKIYFRDISRIESDGALKKIHTVHSKQFETTWATMEEMEEKLQNSPLVRVHRSHMVNIQHIQRYKGGFVKIMDEEIPVGRVYKDLLQKRLLE